MRDHSGVELDANSVMSLVHERGRVVLWVTSEDPKDQVLRMRLRRAASEFGIMVTMRRVDDQVVVTGIQSQVPRRELSSAEVWTAMNEIPPF